MHHSLRLAGLIGALGFIACASTPPATPKAPAADAPAATPDTVTVKVVGLSDFHGGLTPLEVKLMGRSYGGIANIGGRLQHIEKLDPTSSLILDNGDMWTGTDISTILKGKPVIEAYNALGVEAANIANHEFDFGMEVLKERISEASFPFLGANIVEAGTDKAPPFIKPWVILDKQGVKVAVIGLSYLKTPETTLAQNVAGLSFLPYGETLKRVVPAVREAGADVIVVLFHDTVAEVKKVLEAQPGLGIQAIIAGQNHRKEAAEVDGTHIANPGYRGRAYVRFDIVVDKKSRQVRSVTHEIVDVEGDIHAPPAPPTPALLEVVRSAKERASSLASEVLGSLAKPLPVGSFANSPLGHMIADAWLAAAPSADFAIINHGAIREPLAQGEVTVGDIISVLPFSNNLFIVELTGQQLMGQLTIDHPVVAGMTWQFREREGAREVVKVVDQAGQTLEPNKVYRVVINDFMYTGGDGFRFQDIDSTPEDTGLSLREPVMRALRRAKSLGRPLPPPTGARAGRVR